MKKQLFIICVLFSNYCMGQLYVNHKNLSNSDEAYIEVWEKYDPSSGKFYAMVDYGQDEVTSDDNACLKVHDADKKFVQFNSTVAILNFMHTNGWMLVQMKSSRNTSSYLMQRRSAFYSKPKNEHVNTTIGAVD